MRLLIITHVQHRLKDGHYYGYGPYVKEMNLWIKHSDTVEVVAHQIKGNIDPIDLPYSKEVIFTRIPQLSLLSLKKLLQCVYKIPMICYRLFKAMRNADHIHLRCPGNIGLLGAIVQIVFPSKLKTAKYAGNWDPKAKQPWSYTLQKKILSNTFLTKNMNVLVYGNWPGQSKNITSFFTASYQKSAIPEINTLTYVAPYKMIFVGSLSPGKRPMYALEFIKKCLESAIDISLDFYGEGNQREAIEKYIKNHKLENNVTLHGNQNATVIREAYLNSHFLILPSKSEGWPKVIAEAMFWGVIPLGTSISCVPWMLDHGKRGVLVSLDLEKDVTAFAKAISNPSKLQMMSHASQEWSHQYTLDQFEEAIKQFLCG